MIVSYAQEAPLSQAVVKTFDGQHPCKLCKQIAKSKRAEKKSDCTFELSKLQFPYAPFVFIFSSPSSFWEVRLGDDGANILSYSPPSPPPKGLLT
jgi:hypothetical protein